MFALVAMIALAQDQRISYEYDEVRDISSTQIEVGPLYTEERENANRVRASIHITSNGPRPGRSVSTVRAVLSSVNDGWRYLRYHTVAIKVDEDRMDLNSSATFDSNLLRSGGCYEASLIRLDVDTAERIAEAADVKIAYGSDTFVLEPSQRRLFGLAATLARDPSRLEEVLRRLEEDAERARQRDEQARVEAEAKARRMKIAKEYEDAYDRVEQLARRETRNRDRDRVLKQGHARIVQAIQEKYGVSETDLGDWVKEYRRDR